MSPLLRRLDVSFCLIIAVLCNGISAAEAKRIEQTFALNNASTVVIRASMIDSATIKINKKSGQIKISAKAAGGVSGYHSPDSNWKETPADQYGMVFVAKLFEDVLVISTRNEIQYLHHHYYLDRIRIHVPKKVVVIREERALDGDGAANLNAPTHEQLGLGYFKASQLEKSLFHFRKYLDSDPNEAPRSLNQVRQLMMKIEDTIQRKKVQAIIEKIEYCLHWAGEASEGDPARARDIQAGADRDCSAAVQGVVELWPYQLQWEYSPSRDEKFKQAIANLMDLLADSGIYGSERLSNNKELVQVYCERLQGALKRQETPRDIDSTLRRRCLQ